MRRSLLLTSRHRGGLRSEEKKTSHPYRANEKALGRRPETLPEKLLVRSSVGNEEDVHHRTPRSARDRRQDEDQIFRDGGISTEPSRIACSRLPVSQRRREVS
jgi:hypothetical protein